MKVLRSSIRFSGSIAALALLVAGALAAIGCQPRTQPAQESEGTAAAPEQATVGTPMTFSWDQQSNCLNYSPPTINVNAGSQANFNTSTDDTVWVTAPAGCFAAAETTFAVVRGQNDANPTAHTIGSYELVIRPAVCSATTGGPGPSVIVDTGVGGDTR